MKTRHRFHQGALNLLPLAVAIAAMAASAAMADLISTLYTSAFLDSHEDPAPRVAENGSITIDLAGGWFDSGACELLVDGVAVASSSGTLQTYALAADPTTWRSYRLTLRSQEGETTKIVTVYPYAGFICSLHGLEFGECPLDARPAGTIRRLLTDATMPVTWSAIWNDGADAPVVALRRENGLEGPLLGTLVSGETDAEGETTFSPHAYPLGPGLYTLTHFDGIETLMSVIEVRSHALIFSLR